MKRWKRYVNTQQYCTLKKKNKFNCGNQFQEEY